MSEFVSEPITPQPGGFDTEAMARGEPGLPSGFTWRGTSCGIVELLAQWKQSSPEGGRADGERYLRRHCYRLRMSDGAIWTVYFVRSTPQRGPARRRWFLYTIDTREPQ